MLSNSFIAFIFLVASISSVNAHAGLNPAIGIKGDIVRNDVQRPSPNSPCGNVNIAQNLDNSTAVPADADGNFSPTIVDFNPGADGSRSIKTVEVDASGTGKNLVAAKMVVNGDANPTTTATEKLTAQLPPNTKCTGGTNGNLCLASFTTTAGFGNCVVVSQGAGAQNASASPSTSGQSKSLRRGAAKGMNRSTDSRAASDDQKGEKASDEKKSQNNGGKQDDKKDKKKGKDDKKKQADKKGNGKRDEEKENDSAVKNKSDAKNGDKKKGDKKKGDDKKKGKGNKKTAKPAKANPTAADGSNNHKRSWSSRQMGKL